MFQQPDSDDNFGPMPLSPGQLDYITCTNYYMWGHTSSYIIFSLHTFSIFFSYNWNCFSFKFIFFFTGLSD